MRTLVIQKARTRISDISPTWASQRLVRMEETTFGKIIRPATRPMLDDAPLLTPRTRTH